MGRQKPFNGVCLCQQLLPSTALRLYYRFHSHPSSLRVVIIISDMATEFQELTLVTPVSPNIRHGLPTVVNTLQDELSLQELYKEVTYSRAAAFARLKYYERNVEENPACGPLFGPEVATLRASLGQMDSILKQAQSNGLLPAYHRKPRAAGKQPYKVRVCFIRSFIY